MRCIIARWIWDITVAQICIGTLLRVLCSAHSLVQQFQWEQGLLKVDDGERDLSTL